MDHSHHLPTALEVPHPRVDCVPGKPGGRGLFLQESLLNLPPLSPCSGLMHLEEGAPYRPS